MPAGAPDRPPAPRLPPGGAKEGRSMHSFLLGSSQSGTRSGSSISASSAGIETGHSCSGSASLEHPEDRDPSVSQGSKVPKSNHQENISSATSSASSILDDNFREILDEVDHTDESLLKQDGNSHSNIQKLRRAGGNEGNSEKHEPVNIHTDGKGRENDTISECKGKNSETMTEDKVGKVENSKTKIAQENQIYTTNHGQRLKNIPPLSVKIITTLNKYNKLQTPGSKEGDRRIQSPSSARKVTSPVSEYASCKNRIGKGDSNRGNQQEFSPIIGSGSKNIKTTTPRRTPITPTRSNPTTPRTSIFSAKKKQDTCTISSNEARNTSVTTTGNTSSMANSPSATPRDKPDTTDGVQNQQYVTMELYNKLRLQLSIERKNNMRLKSEMENLSVFGGFAPPFQDGVGIVFDSTELDNPDNESCIAASSLVGCGDRDRDREKSANRYRGSVCTPPLIKNLENELMEKNSEIIEMKNRIKDLESEIQRREKAEKARQVKEDFTKTIMPETVELNNERYKNAELQATVNRLTERIAVLEKENSTLTKSLKRLRLDQSEAYHGGNSSYAEIYDPNKQKEEYIAELEKSCQALRIQAAKAFSEKTQTEFELSALRREMEEMKTQHKTELESLKVGGKRKEDRE